ncbi:MAG: S1C family serine protease [Fimbriimonadaceae bacterium]
MKRGTVIAIALTASALTLAAVFGVIYFVDPFNFRGQPSDSPVFITAGDELDGERSADVRFAQLGGQGERPSFDFTGAAETIMPSVVSIDTLVEGRDLFGRIRRQEGSGSGVIISSDGYIVTNNHVIEGARNVNVNLIDGRSYEAEVIGTVPRVDLAVLQIPDEDLTPAVFADGEPRVGQWVLAVGNPFGYENTLSVGVLSSSGRSLPPTPTRRGQDLVLLTELLQTDAAINPGNSGGALANADGELIGINTAIANVTGASVGIGFAIPASRVQRVVDDIVRYGYVRYGYLGVSVYQQPGLMQNRAVREELGERAEGDEEPPTFGALVETVEEGSAAARAGIGPLDVIMRIDGERITDNVDLLSSLFEKEPNAEVSIQVWSDGEVKTLTARLQEMR